MKQPLFGGRKLVHKLLQANLAATHPGRGKENAQLVREVCKYYGFNEDDYLPKFVVRDKKTWGL